MLGDGPFALHEAEYLQHLADKVTVLTHGKDDSLAKAAGFATITTPLKAITGDARLEALQFEDGSTLMVNGLFIALGTADSTDMARKLGAQLDGRFIKVDADGSTNIPGLFAAGDCIGGLKQVSKAVHDGARAGLAIIKHLRK